MEFKIKDIPTERKVDLVGLTISEAYFENIVNPMLLDIFFKTNMILMYTDIPVTDEEKQDKLALYDKLKSEKVVEEFLIRLEQELPGEQDYLLDNLYTWKHEITKYRSSAAGLLDSFKMFFDNTSAKTTEVLQKLESIDLNELKTVIPIAQSLGMENNSPTE